MSNQTDSPIVFTYRRELLCKLGISFERLKCKTQPQHLLDVHACIDAHTHVPKPICRVRQRSMLSVDFTNIQKHDILRSLLRRVLY
jgi:hypothetical protein